MAAASLADRLRADILETGPIPVRVFVAAALYGEPDGFYVAGGRAGRRGDFLTAPEVGPLFGAVLSNAVDTWWSAAGCPPRFVVVEHAAGPGTLARTVTAAAGRCLEAGALEWVMIEPSAAQRANHPDGPHLRSEGDDTGIHAADVVFANELLDNLPFDIVTRRDHGWVERLVAFDAARGFVLVDGPTVEVAAATDAMPLGTDLPVIDAAVAWVGAQRRRHPDARLVVVDYAATTAGLVERDGGWLRAYREHQLVADWLHSPGTTDITIDVPLEPLRSTTPSSIRSQQAFLEAHGIVELVEEGRAIWAERAHVGDLAALRARSRISEADALLDPAGMGAFTVLEWEPTID